MEKARRKADLTIGKEKKVKSRWSRERGRMGKARKKADLTIGKGEEEWKKPGKKPT